MDLIALGIERVSMGGKYTQAEYICQMKKTLVEIIQEEIARRGWITQKRAAKELDVQQTRSLPTSQE